MTSANLITRAGGIAPLGSDPQAHLDELSARHYRHAALGERVVCRLVSSTLAAAEDLSLEYHGFESPHSVTPVGRQQRKGLGFPAWALVNDPGRGSLALAVLKEFRTQARLARSRPGAAKDGFVAIAGRLAQSVPHFLPSYFEEAGRVFLEHGHAGMAAQMFGQARQAEKVHALEVDESLRRESFLEFALAGAVSAKALAGYAQELAKEREPQEAYRQYRELCLRRTLGGMPPWTAMLKDLHRLAKAAGLSPTDEQQSLLTEILNAPALARAPLEFWSSAKASVKALCLQGDGEHALMVLKLKPSFPGDRARHGQSWLQLLEEWGLTRLLIEPESPLEPGEAATWLAGVQGLFATYTSAINPDALFPLVRQMAPRLKQEGVPVRLSTDWRQLDLDLVEQLLELEVPLEIVGEQLYGLDLTGWASSPSPERRRDMVFVARHRLMADLVIRSLDPHASNATWQAAVAGRPGWAELQRRWLSEQVDKLEQGGLPALRELLERWEGYQQPRLLAPYPQLRERLARLSLSTLLARTVAGLVPEELGWPALDQAIAELNPDGQSELAFAGYFPYLVVYSKVKAIALDRHQVLARHDLRIPRGHTLSRVLFLDGQFLTVHERDYDEQAQWSGGTRVSLLGGHHFSVSTPSTHLEGIGLTYGARAVQAGDSELPTSPGRLFCDGQTCWVLEWVQDGGRLREMDPRSGKPGRASLPAFLESFAEPGHQLLFSDCWLYPLSEGELVGFRVRKDEAGRVEAESLDGQLRYRSPGRCDYTTGRPLGYLARPAASAAVLWGRWGELTVVDPESGRVLADRAFSPQLPLFELAPLWLPMFSARRLDDSRQLRQCTPQQAGTLLESGSAEKVPGWTLQDPHIRQGVEKLAQTAQELWVRLAPFGQQVEAPSAGSGPLPAAAVADVLATFSLYAHSTHDLREEARFLQGLVEQLGQTINQGGWLQKLSGLLTGKTAAPSVPLPSSSPPLSLLCAAAGHWEALAWRAAAPFTPPEQTRAVAELLELWAASPLLDQPRHFRRIWMDPPENHYDNKLLLVEKGGEHAYLLSRCQFSHRHMLGLEYHPKGAFKPPKQGRLLGSAPLPEGSSRAQRLTRLARLLTQRGPRPWNPQEPVRLAELTGLSLAEACLVSAGLPGILSPEANFLPSPVREQMGLKASQAKTARDSLRSLTQSQRFDLYLLATQMDDPEALWSRPELVTERLAAAWNQVVGRRITVTAERLKELAALPGDDPPNVMLGYLSDLPHSPFSRDARGQQAADEPAFEARHLTGLTAYLSYLHEVAPAGDPLREAAARAWPLALQRLRNPRLRFSTDYLFSEDKNQLAAWRKLAQQAGFEEDPVSWSLRLAYCPAVHHPEQDAFRALQPYLVSTVWSAWLVSLTEEFQQLVERLTAPLPAGVYETDPRVSAPSLLPQVEARLGVSQEAAVLYLQMLALARPTTKNLQLWNGWEARQIKAAAAELVSQGLLLEAKRARAGREHFLPGGWEALKAPELPLETWKLPLYQLPTSPPAFLLNRVLSVRPLGLTFERAWQRIVQGDTPGYDESKALRKER